MDMEEMEALRVFRDMIRIPSVTGSPGEADICSYIEALLSRYGIGTERISRSEDRPNLLAAVRAAHPTEPPLVLISHVDVVPADRERWSHDPFGAEEDEGRIWGRGTLDTKHLTAMELYALIRLRGHEDELNRDVYLLATVDEEKGSAWGMGYVRKARPELFERAVVINEGGGFPLRINGKDYITITVGEKAVCRARLWAEGTPGHASAPTPDQAMLKLARGLRRIFAREAELTCGSLSTWNAMREVAGTEPWDDPTASDILGYASRSAISMRNYTIGVKSNVIPAAAEAVLEFRLLPFAAAADVEAYLARCLEGCEVRFEILGYEDGMESGFGDPGFRRLIGILSDACGRAGFEGGLLPMLALGRTDGRFFAGADSAVYGCSPLLMGDSFGAVLPRVHGDDESILVESFRFGSRVLDETIAELCGVSRRACGQEVAE